ncbi:hypothetical protein [Microvirga puerhi]|uniref:Uncharacterized protein n=1 Tax=Microvirga puerhi TaxID=2876078 RepID=A0ABS7VLZ7_9HYPH|nr:hypothetical protein [Microvirga puerhi]MBZ6076165.1 hypothetical protein [Microvirga puerhi]
MLTVLGIVIWGVLIFVIPLLCSNIPCRSATLFAGLNAGILSSSLALDTWAATGGITQNKLDEFLLITLPIFYIASLMIGAATIPKYVLHAPTHTKAIIFGVLGAIANYFLFMILVNVAGLVRYIYLNSPLQKGAMLGLFIELVTRVLHFDHFAITVIIVSSLVSMVASVAIIQKTENLFDSDRQKH